MLVGFAAVAEGRDEFLTRLRASLRTGRGPAPTPEPAVSHVTADAEDLVARFCGEALAAGADISRVDSQRALRERLLEIITELGARQLVRANTGLLESLELDTRLHASGIELTVCDLRLSGSARDVLRVESARAQLGLSQADHALAETGTLVFRHRPGQGRALSLLPATHLAILRAVDITANLEVLLRREQRAGEDLGSALTFVTGPSRTADIEMVITTGVHGPARLHIVVLEEAP